VVGAAVLPAGRSVPAMRTTTHHITRGIAVAIALSVALAPAAAAQQDLRMPDTRDAAAKAEQRQDLRLPDTRDYAEGRGTDTAPIVEFVEVREPSGFDWADAGLGAAAGVGLVLIGAGTAMTTARLRRRSVGTARA
jgi:hypothetical protein